MCQGFSHFSGFLHHFVLAKLATSSIRVKFCLASSQNYVPLLGMVLPKNRVGVIIKYV